jgi:hypothetical protein
MVGFMRQLRAFSRETRIPLFVVNNATIVGEAGTLYPSRFPAASETSIRKKPALGPSFPYLTDMTLWLVKCINEDEEGYVAEILRSNITV